MLIILNVFIKQIKKSIFYKGKLQERGKEMRSDLLRASLVLVVALFVGCGQEGNNGNKTPTPTTCTVPADCDEGWRLYHEWVEAGKRMRAHQDSHK